MERTVRQELRLSRRISSSKDSSPPECSKISRAADLNA
jgi:hypothetical protein